MTYTPPFPTNADDIIDSRDVIWHISDLSDDLENAETTDERERIESELAPLLALVEQGEYMSDWEYGVVLVRESHFTEYAQQLAEDLGAIDREAAWPACHIDWEAAADSLMVDYTDLDFDGVTYLAR